MRPPKNQIIENLYTRGNEFLIEKTYDNYVGHYHSVFGKNFIGATYNPKSIALTSYSVNKQNAAYNLSNIDPIYLKLKPGVVNMVKKDEFPITKVKYIRNKEDIVEKWRYFIQKTNVVNAPIDEVDKNTFYKAQNHSFYRAATILWKESLTSDSSLNEAEKLIPGIRLILELS
jgi:hypothetical protein